MKTGKLLWLAAVLLSIPASVQSSDKLVTAAMAGDWRGEAHVIVNWVQQTNLPISVSICSDGIVSGTIGNARLKDGEFKRNRGALGRSLNLGTDYIITGKLEGPLLANEQVSRASVSIPLNFTNRTFVGGLHSSGSKLGRKENGILSARVKLEKF